MSAGSERPAASFDECGFRPADAPCLCGWDAAQDAATKPRFMHATHPMLRGRIERLLAPGFSICMRCGRPWNRVDEHLTPYSENGAGCFPLCESCWSSLTPEERLPYYDELVDEWIRQVPENAESYESKRMSIREAVLNGR